MAMLTAGDVENMGVDAAREMLAVLLTSMNERDIIGTIREVYDEYEDRAELADAITGDLEDDLDC
jgi:hypothetical protein